ncbi:Hypothetical predicted protein [Pelobates cultripes]|uniref:Uncharacterized protein n=1 Tax=Pelobates cultripes TaxID=61616 RepID=A0AAD1VK90_PELCU|nr:Hypothetical predicted protein [Pelobates cultripes]
MGIKRVSSPPQITSVLRVSKSAAAPDGAPRDTIAIMKDDSVRNTIINHSRSLGNISFQSGTVAVYGDIPFSALVEKRKLAPIARRLRDCSIKYRWGTEVSIQAAHGDGILTLSLADDSEAFLGNLGPPPGCKRGWGGTGDYTIQMLDALPKLDINGNVEVAKKYKRRNDRTKKRRPAKSVTDAGLLKCRHTHLSEVFCWRTGAAEIWKDT